jgi:hypothetical protein
MVSKNFFLILLTLIIVLLLLYPLLRRSICGRYGPPYRGYMVRRCWRLVDASLLLAELVLFIVLILLFMV